MSKIHREGFTRQRQPNYFSARIKSVGGHFTASQLGTIKDAAEIFGKGYIHLTSRQGIAIPFIHADNLDALKNFLSADGVSVDVSNSSIVACQGNAVCPSGLIDTHKLAAEFEERYGGRKLPRRFKFGIAGCPNNCLKVEENDIGVKGGIKPVWCAENCTFCGACQINCPQKIITLDKSAKSLAFDESNCIHCGKCIKNCPVDAWRGESGFIISFGGQIVVGKNFLPILFDEPTLYKLLDAALNFFADNAKSGERFSKMLERVGREKFFAETESIALALSS